MKKLKIIFTIIFLAGIRIGLACDLCKKNQPKGLENITHGAGPSGPMDYVISWGGVVIVLITLVLFIKYLVKPKDAAHDQIKNIVVNNE
jgi:hypothetical protein